MESPISLVEVGFLLVLGSIVIGAYTFWKEKVTSSEFVQGFTATLAGVIALGALEGP